MKSKKIKIILFSFFVLCASIFACVHLVQSISFVKSIIEISADFKNANVEMEEWRKVFYFKNLSREIFSFLTLVLGVFLSFTFVIIPDLKNSYSIRYTYEQYKEYRKNKKQKRNKQKKTNYANN